MKTKLSFIMIALIAFALNAFAQTGVTTISYTGTGDENDEVKITATAGDSIYSQVFTIDGLTSEQAVEMIITDLQGKGWAVSKLGKNGIQFTGRNLADGTIAPLAKIDAGNNDIGIRTGLAGSVPTEILANKKGDWVFLGDPAGSIPGTLEGTVGNHTVSTALESGDSPETVAAKLALALTDEGFSVILEGNTVSLDLDDPINDVLLPGDIFEFGMELVDGNGGPHLQLVFPSIIYEVIPTLSEWGVIILILLTLSVGMVFISKRETALALAGNISVGTAASKRKLFDKRLYAKVFGVVLLIGFALLGLSYLYFGEITTADPFGTFVSAAIVAFMVHFWMLKKSQAE